MQGQGRFWKYIAISYSMACLIIFLVWLRVDPIVISLSFLQFNDLNVSEILLGMLTAYTFLSWRIVSENESAAKILLGIPIQDVTSGPAFVPLGVCRLRREPRYEFHIRFPDEVDRRPIRITTGGNTAGTDPVDVSMQVEISLALLKA